MGLIQPGIYTYVILSPFVHYMWVSITGSVAFKDLRRSFRYGVVDRARRVLSEMAIHTIGSVSPRPPSTASCVVLSQDSSDLVQDEKLGGTCGCRLFITSGW